MPLQIVENNQQGVLPAVSRNTWPSARFGARTPRAAWAIRGAIINTHAVDKSTLFALAKEEAPERAADLALAALLEWEHWRQWTDTRRAFKARLRRRVEREKRQKDRENALRERIAAHRGREAGKRASLAILTRFCGQKKERGERPSLCPYPQNRVRIAPPGKDTRPPGLLCP